jgi:hypothetical protein
MKRLDEIEADDRPSFRDLGIHVRDGSLQNWLLMYTVQLSNDLANSDIKEFVNQNA